MDTGSAIVLLAAIVLLLLAAFGVTVRRVSLPLLAAALIVVAVWLLPAARAAEIIT